MPALLMSHYCSCCEKGTSSVNQRPGAEPSSRLELVMRHGACERCICRVVRVGTVTGVQDSSEGAFMW